MTNQSLLPDLAFATDCIHSADDSSESADYSLLTTTDSCAVRARRLRSNVYLRDLAFQTAKQPHVSAVRPESLIPETMGCLFAPPA